MLQKFRNLIKENKLDAFLVNSTNEFLVEYNSLEQNSRYKLTGFSGSTGDALITEDKVYLFVDGRYHIQADNEVDHSIVTVVKLQKGDTALGKMQELLNENSRLGLVSKKNSQARVEDLSNYFELVFFEKDLFEKNMKKFRENIEQTDESVSGIPVKEKLRYIRQFLGDDDAILVTSLEEVSYIFNIRDFSKPYSSAVMRKAIITKNLANLYDEYNFENYKNDLQGIKGKIFVDKKSVNARDYSFIKDKAVLRESDDNFNLSLVSEMKSCKTNAELEHYKDCFARTDMAMRMIRNYIQENDDISEFDIEKKLKKYFRKFGARSLSFKSIIAKDKNSALAHYSKCSKEEIIKEGSLILIDCGAYYDGGLATDITRVFIKGQASNLQKLVYTIVLKAFLLAYNTEIKDEISGFDIDKKVREFFEEHPINGFEFNHGLGHGIGISVQEPGLYNKDYFGVRLENSCYCSNGKIHSFTEMNFEKRLINYELLTEQELIWLKEFEVK